VSYPTFKVLVVQSVHRLTEVRSSGQRPPGQVESRVNDLRVRSPSQTPPGQVGSKVNT